MYAQSRETYLLAIRWAVAQTMTGCSAEDVTIISVIATSAARCALRRVLIDVVDGLLVDYTVRVNAQAADYTTMSAQLTSAVNTREFIYFMIT